MKMFWTYIKHQRTASAGVSPLKAQGRLITDPKQKVEKLNAQFNRTSSSRKNFTAEQIKRKCTMQDSADRYPPPPSFTATDQGVAKLVTNLSPNKATGPDGISPRVLKELA